MVYLPWKILSPYFIYTPNSGRFKNPPQTALFYWTHIIHVLYNIYYHVHYWRSGRRGEGYFLNKNTLEYRIRLYCIVSTYNIIVRTLLYSTTGTWRMTFTTKKKQHSDGGKYISMIYVRTRENTISVRVAQNQILYTGDVARSHNTAIVRLGCYNILEVVLKWTRTNAAAPSVLESNVTAATRFSFSRSMPRIKYLYSLQGGPPRYGNVSVDIFLFSL